MKTLQLALAGVLTAGLAWVAAPGSAAGASTVTCNGVTHAVTGTDVRRTTNALVVYDSMFGATTGTNEFGDEASVTNSKVTANVNSVGNMAIPATGFVLSGHGTSRTWLLANAKVGATCTLDTTQPPPPPPPPGGNALLPDLGIRTLRQFTIANVGGVKELKFPVVMPNVGAGPFEIHGTRSSSTSTDWASTQTIYNDDKSKTVVNTPGATFFYAGDGHNHWHVRQLQLYQIYNSAGTLLDRGAQAKQGFCFEDNTSYRDWPGNPKHPAAPASPVYLENQSCGAGNPSATSIQEGLSVGWGDTYPSTLPNQYIDVTGLPNGTYTVKVIADWANWYKETNENNNSASARISISGNTVTLLSATDGL